MPNKGVKVIGPVPAEVLVFGSITAAYLGPHAANPDEAQKFLRFLATPAATKAFRAIGLSPAKLNTRAWSTPLYRFSHRFPRSASLFLKPHRPSIDLPRMVCERRVAARKGAMLGLTATEVRSSPWPIFRRWLAERLPRRQRAPIGERGIALRSPPSPASFAVQAPLLDPIILRQWIYGPGSVIPGDASYSKSC